MSALSMYLSFRGRITRSAYWLDYQVPIFLLLVLFLAVDLLRGVSFFSIGCIIVLWPLLAGTAKRLHDRDKPVWYLLIPIANIWYFIELLFCSGTIGHNRFGHDPRTSETLVVGPMGSNLYTEDRPFDKMNIREVISRLGFLRKRSWSEKSGSSRNRNPRSAYATLRQQVAQELLEEGILSEGEYELLRRRLPDFLE